MDPKSAERGHSRRVRPQSCSMRFRNASMIGDAGSFAHEALNVTLRHSPPQAGPVVKQVHCRSTIRAARYKITMFNCALSLPAGGAMQAVALFISALYLPTVRLTYRKQEALLFEKRSKNFYSLGKR